MRHFLKKLDHFFGKLEFVAIVLIFTAMLGFASVQIVLRFFHSGIVWIDPFLRSLVLWGAFLGGAKSIHQSTFIKMDLAEKLFPERWNAPFRRLLATLSFLLCAYLLWIACFYVNEEMKSGEVAFLNVKTWQVQLAFPLGFFLMTWHFFCKIFTEKPS